MPHLHFCQRQVQLSNASLMIMMVLEFSQPTNLRKMSDEQPNLAESLFLEVLQKGGR